MNHRKWLVIPATLGAFLCGCMSKDLVFVTKTSVGLDIDGSPTSVSLAYDRVEGFVGPRYTDGTAPPVIGIIASEGDLPERQVRQTFAVGNAAEIVAGKNDSAVPAPFSPDQALDSNSKTMYFGTASTIGLKFGLDTAGTTVASATFGYKRKELSVVPVTGRTFPSLFASMNADAKPAAVKDAKFGVTQYFATGAAADRIAPKFQETFKQAADAIASYRSEESAQQSAALMALSCVTRLKDNQLSDAFSNAGELSIFDDPSLTKTLTQEQPALARATYARYMTVLDAKEPSHTQALLAHEKHVCALANQT